MTRVTSTCLLVLLVLTLASDLECRRTGSSSRRGNNRGNKPGQSNSDASRLSYEGQGQPKQQTAPQQQSPIAQSAQAPSLQSSNHPGGQGSNPPGQGQSPIVQSAQAPSLQSSNRPGGQSLNPPPGQGQSPIAQSGQPQPIGWNVPNSQHGTNQHGQPGSPISAQSHSPIAQSAPPAYPGQGGYGGANPGYGVGHQQPQQYNPQQPQYYGGGGGYNPGYHQGGYGGGGYGGGYGMGGYGGGYGHSSNTGSNLLMGAVGGLLIWNLVSGSSSSHYTVHNYYNEGMKNETIKLQANAIIDCPQNATMLCPGNTTSLCTSDSKILCVTIATIPCANNSTLSCVNSTVPQLPCINGANANGPCNDTSSLVVTSINIPCITNASILGDLKDANATVLSSSLFQNATSQHATQFCVTTIAIPQKPSICDGTDGSKGNGTACNPTNVDIKPATAWPVVATALIAENNTMVQLQSTTESTKQDK